MSEGMEIAKRPGARGSGGFLLMVVLQLVVFAPGSFPAGAQNLHLGDIDNVNAEFDIAPVVEHGSGAPALDERESLLASFTRDEAVNLLGVEERVPDATGIIASIGYESTIEVGDEERRFLRLFGSPLGEREE